jgi:hypothetical protein
VCTNGQISSEMIRGTCRISFTRSRCLPKFKNWILVLILALVRVLLLPVSRPSSSSPHRSCTSSRPSPSPRRIPHFVALDRLSPFTYLPDVVQLVFARQRLCLFQPPKNTLFEASKRCETSTAFGVFYITNPAPHFGRERFQKFRRQGVTS